MGQSVEENIAGGVDTLAREKKIPLVESFGPTIQGEGSVIGFQTMFLRLGGCDSRCGRCDSLHAVLPKLFMPVAQRLTAAELLEHTMAISGHTEWITISGGNPCMWDLTDLVQGLQKAGKRVAIETQGTLFPRWLPMCDKVTVSPKGPGMQEPSGFNYAAFGQIVDHLLPAEGADVDQDDYMSIMMGHLGFSVKVVIFDQRDIEFMVELMQLWPQLRDVMYASIGNVNPPEPAHRDAKEQTYEEFVFTTLRNYEMLAGEIMQDPRCATVKILPQLHTLIWGNRQGV